MLKEVAEKRKLAEIMADSMEIPKKMDAQTPNRRSTWKKLSTCGCCPAESEVGPEEFEELRVFAHNMAPVGVEEFNQNEDPSKVATFIQMILAEAKEEETDKHR